MSLQKSRMLQTYQVFTKDRHFTGHISSLLFNEAFYYIQYMVIDTSDWLPGRMRLISPEAVQKTSPEEKCINLAVSRKQIETGPDVFTHLPVSSQAQIRIARHYGWPMQRLGNFVPLPGVTAPSRISSENGSQPQQADMDNYEDFPLRSTEEVIGSRVYNKTDKIGIVDDFLVETDEWRLIYFILKEGNLLHTDYLRISCRWIREIDWDKSKVLIDLATNVIRHAAF